jgi:hypothetical protein
LILPREFSVAMPTRGNDTYNTEYTKTMPETYTILEFYEEAKATLRKHEFFRTDSRLRVLIQFADESPQLPTMQFSITYSFGEDRIYGYGKTPDQALRRFELAMLDLLSEFPAKNIKI